MKHDIETLKQSLRAAEGLARATSGDYQNLKDAIDELEALRRNETLAANYANRELNAEREISQLKHMVEHLRSAPPIRVHFGDATGENLQRIKAEWLKSLESGTPLREVRFADERTTELTKRIAELEEQVQTLAKERDDAKADAARLREDGTRFIAALDGGKIDSDSIVAGDDFEEALAATDSSEWLEAHDEALIRKTGAVLELKCASLEAQLAAALNDAARAELRARELFKALKHVELCRVCAEDVEWRSASCESGRKAGELLAAAPDSDARLREVVERVTHRGIVCGESRGSAGIYDEKSRENDVKFIVDEVLGVKP